MNRLIELYNNRKKAIRQKYKQLSLQKLKSNSDTNHKDIRQTMQIRSNYNKLIIEKPIYRIINNLSVRIYEKLEHLNIIRKYEICNDF